MSSSEYFVIQDGVRPYGKLQAGFQIELSDKGYFTIAGLNNSGKTTVLQWLSMNAQNSIYLPAERGIVRPTFNSSTIPLKQYVDAFRNRIAGGPLDAAELSSGSTPRGGGFTYEEVNSYSQGLLPSMMRSKGIKRSTTELEQYVRQFLLGDEVDDQEDQLLIDKRSITQMGTGARSLLLVIMALIHPGYITILIDEPELFLEPRLQKALRDLFVEKATEKRIVVATHSHLFLN